MKKIYFCLFLLLGSLTKAHAAAGNAKDGPLFSLTIIGLLLILSGILFFIDFIKGGGMQIIRKFIFHKLDKMIRYFKKIWFSLTGYRLKVFQP